jgi:glutaconyl-CoA/methylmalonyl-CoA decarboxylase subunit gamma
VPSFDVTIQGKTYHVEIPDPGRHPLQIIVDGQPFEVAIVGTEAAGAVEGAEVKLAKAPRPAPPPPAALPTALPPLPRVAVARPVAPAGSNGGHDIHAPMPGTILSVAVEIGQAVEAGQVVCVLEAMKMKNPIRANGSGTVAAIAVTAGQTVAYGDLLVTLV